MKHFLMALTVMMFSCLAAGAEDLILESGDYRIHFSEKPERWSIVQIFYQGAELGTRTGFYSSIFCPRSGKYIGAGHTEGGLEKVLNVRLEADGAEKPVAPGVCKGSRLVLTKTSMLANLKMETEYVLTPEELKLTRNFTALEEQPAHQLYLFQFCWNWSSTDYLFGRDDGTTGGGKFLHDRKMRVYGEESAYYFSQFFPDLKKGVISFMPGFGLTTGRNLLWDVPKAYHKQYFWINHPKVMPKGYASPKVAMVIRGFSAETVQDWENGARALAGTLLKKYPFAPMPEVCTPLNDTVYTMPPSDKFQVRKIALPLEKNTRYSIALELCKEPEISKVGTDSCVLLGYYNSKRVFRPIQYLGTKIPADRQYHSIQSAFRTPETKEKIYLYVYNSRSSGKMMMKNLIVKKVKE